jgi:hypothetical protein
MNHLALARRHLLATGAVALAGMAWRVAHADRSGGGASFARAAADGAHPAPANGGRLIRVGPGRDAETISAAADLAGDDDLVEIDAGEYRGDVAVWKQKRLSIRAHDGPVRILADGRHAEGKGIWVIRDGEFRNPIGHDFRLGKRAWSRATAVPLPPFGDAPPAPTEQYRHPMGTEPVPPGTPRSPGAFQSGPP